jgi:glycosyltransferase involved in cell wall biosynthesis
MSLELLWHFLFWLYAAATLAQLAVWWGVFKKLEIGNWKLEIPESSISNFQFPISIIICARNEAENLRHHLPKILEQEYAGEWEVVVVDDASEDETPAVLQVFLEKNSRLRVVQIFEKQHFGKKHALAQGIAAAKFENLLLTDADCEPASPRWLAQMASALAEKPETEIALGYAPMKKSAENWLNAWARFETAYTAMQYFSFALAGMPYMGVGRNLAFKKKIFGRVGGFATHLDLPSGDDDLLVNAAATSKNATVCLHPESFMPSESKKTWRDWARQKRRHLSAGKRYKSFHQAILGLVSLSHALHFFLLAVLLSARVNVAVVASLYFIRGLLVLFVCFKIFPKLGESRLLARLPIFDALLAIYSGIFVPLALMARKNDW